MATLGGLEIDVVEVEQPTYSNTITEKAVEDGADISDHIIRQPIKIKLNTVFSGNESMEKYDSLISMRDSEELYEYSGAFGDYENMGIESISPLKNATFGDGYECTISLKQVLIVELETIDITLGVDPETGEQVQGEESETSEEEKETESEEIDEESIPDTSLRIFTNLGIDKFGSEGENGVDVISGAAPSAE
ncbi:MAG: hypothetical protein K9L62_15900 [Vallitaleaceae bacterium]|nr:hypothetical protein [Vallitaleaceae bacterium]